MSYTQNAGVELCVEAPISEQEGVAIDSEVGSANSVNRTIKVQKPPIIYPSLPVAVIREATGPLAVLVCGVTYWVYGGVASWPLFVDPGICILQVIVLGFCMFRGAKDSGLALMLTIPTHIDIHGVQNRLMEKVGSKIHCLLAD